MNDTELLDYLEKSMRQNIGWNTPEHYIGCDVHMQVPIRQALEEAAKKWPDGRGEDNQ